MKTHVLRTSILALLVAAAGDAQSYPQLHANVPFEFVAGGATLTPGDYTVEPAGPDFIVLRSHNKGAFVRAAAVKSAGVPSVSKLVFHRYGGTYVLSQVWTKGDTRGHQATVTAHERELAGRSRARDETIILAMR